MQPKKRVAFFGDDFSRKGKGTALVVQKLVEKLVERYSDTIEITLLRPAGACLSPACDRVKHVIIPRKFSTMLSYFWFFLTHRTRCDVIVFNQVVYPGFFFLSARRKILIAHDASISEVYIVPRTPVTRLFEFFIRVQKPFIDIVVGVSDDAAQRVQKYFHFPSGKVRRLYLAAGEEFHPFSDEEKKQAILRLEKLAIKQPYILDVSRFDPHKNIGRVIDAFCIAKARGISHSLVFVGGSHTPGYSERILEQIRSSKYTADIHVVDYVEDVDMPALYACAGLLLFPSLVEGFGLPILEAMKSGTPVITSNISSMPEISGGAGKLVNPVDTIAIQKAIEELLQSGILQSELKTSGINRANNFSWEESARVFLGFLS